MTWDPVFWSVAAVAVILLGLSKGGLVGVGAIALPLMATVASPVASAAILLPILIVQDTVGVWAFRRTWDAHILRVLMPGSVAGIALGYLLAAKVSPDVVLACVGLLSITFGGYRLWIERRDQLSASASSPDWVGGLFGIATGFTSQIAHAGGPPYQMWVMPKQLPRDTFVGTTAIFFAATNWLKVPTYFALGQFTASNMRATVLLMPVAILSTFAGVRLVRYFSAERLYTIIYLLMILIGCKLIFDAVRALT